MKEEENKPGISSFISRRDRSCHWHNDSTTTCSHLRSRLMHDALIKSKKVSLSAYNMYRELLYSIHYILLQCRWCIETHCGNAYGRLQLIPTFRRVATIIKVYFYFFVTYKKLASHEARKSFLFFRVHFKCWATNCWSLKFRSINIKQVRIEDFFKQIIIIHFRWRNSPSTNPKFMFNIPVMLQSSHEITMHDFFFVGCFYCCCWMLLNIAYKCIKRLFV